MLRLDKELLRVSFTEAHTSTSDRWLQVSEQEVREHWVFPRAVVTYQIFREIWRLLLVFELRHFKHPDPPVIAKRNTICVFLLSIHNIKELWEISVHFSSNNFREYNVCARNKIFLVHSSLSLQWYMQSYNYLHIVHIVARGKNVPLSSIFTLIREIGLPV